MPRSIGIRGLHGSARALLRVRARPTKCPEHLQQSALATECCHYSYTTDTKTSQHGQTLEFLEQDALQRRQTARTLKSPPSRAAVELERLQSAHEAKQPERSTSKTFIPSQEASQEALHALSLDASRVEGSISAVALQQLRRVAISHKAQLDKKETRLGVLSAQQRSIRRHVDKIYGDRDHGKHIWIFCHLRTGQTIYSLENKLSQSSLSQLNFVGKQSVPTNLRPDYWQCIAIVSFPTHFQGLHAFRCLHEYRVMHEHCWDTPEPPPSAGNKNYYHDPTSVNSFTIDNESSALMTGTKTSFNEDDDVHWSDMIASRRKRTKIPKKELTRMLQNQRANSIADLAAALYLQERKAAGETKKWKARWIEWDREDAKSWRRTRHLAQLSERGEVPIIESRVAELEQQLASMEDGEAKQRMKKEVDNARHELLMIQQAPAKIALQKERRREIAELAKEHIDRVTWASPEKKAFVQEMLTRMIYHYHYTVFSKELIPGTGKLKDKGGWRVKVLLDKLFPMKKGFFSMHGVEIRWADELDIGVAQSWPNGVTHIVAGQYLRYGAWHPDVLDQMKRLQDQRERNEIDAST